MNPLARISLLLGALVLLVFGIVCLKQQLRPTSVPPAFVNPEASELEGANRAHSEPTILSPEPATEREYPGSPRWRDESPATPETPVNTLVPAPIPLPAEEPGVRFPPPAPPPAAPSNSNDQRGQEAGVREDVLSFRFPAQQPTSPVVPAAAWQPLAPARSRSESSNPPIQSAIQSAIQPAVALGVPEPVPQEDPNPPEWVDETRTVENDSLWLIAERHYGRGDYYRALYAANRDRLPAVDRLPAGLPLHLPKLNELHRRFPEACPKSVVFRPE